ncbi:MAG: branched-chain amino acid transport system substrate-binding protein [Gaiellales bacterium]|nr:branched-chain amino acid transport system substrate-binding protein [Gaiellales bacterium]
MSKPRVYVSLPLTGPMGGTGRELLRAAELAVEQHENPVGVVPLDSFADDREEQAAAHATRAAADLGALAYLGDFHSSQVQRTAPILAAADMLTVAPVATFASLQGPTLVRLMPHDGVGARAIAGWLVDARVHRLLVVHDHGRDYGVSVGAMCTDAARSRGIDARSRPVWNHDERPADDLGDADAVLYVGVAGSGAAGMWRELHESNPQLWLLGSEGVADPRFAREIPSTAAERTRLFVAPRAPLPFYGFESMALILDSIKAGEGVRASTVHAARTTRERSSILGRYSIDKEGHTTSTAYGRLRIAGGELVWDGG